MLLKGDALFLILQLQKRKAVTRKHSVYRFAIYSLLHFFRAPLHVQSV